MSSIAEKDAKTRWCPLARFKAGDASGAFNRYSGFQKEPHPDMMCIGPDCMAWRWRDFVPPNKTSGEDWYEGYCGAFGEPRR